MNEGATSLLWSLVRGVVTVVLLCALFLVIATVLQMVALVVLP